MESDLEQTIAKLTREYDEWHNSGYGDYAKQKWVDAIEAAWPNLLRAAARAERYEKALQDVRPYIGHHERCPGWGNDQGASCNCGGQDGYAIIDAALADRSEVQP